jgi:hypothetical protein
MTHTINHPVSPLVLVLLFSTPPFSLVTPDFLPPPPSKNRAKLG